MHCCGLFPLTVYCNARYGTYKKCIKKLLRCYVTCLFGRVSVFVRRIKDMLQVRPEQVCTVHRAETRNTTAPASCSHSSSCCNRTSTHKPRTRDFSWAPVGPQSDVDADRVMVNIDTSILMINPNLSDSQIKMNSVLTLYVNGLWWVCFP